MATPSRNFFSAPPDAAPLLRLEDLSVHFPFEGRLLPAVRDVHLELPPAAITCLVGESGCGKSLTARAVRCCAAKTCSACRKRSCAASGAAAWA